MGQRYILSPILLALYIAFLFYILKKRTKNLSIPILVSILYFVDNSLLISQEKIYKKSNAILYCNYSILLSFFNQFDLAIEHNKLEVFYFSKSIKNTEPPLLDLKLVDDTILKPKYIWCYLYFFFDKKLSFWYHICYYTNKALSIIKDMKMLSNSIRELSPIHKCLLYKTCILFIALYGF